MSFLENMHILAGKYPIDDQFIEEMRQYVIGHCQKAPTQAYKVDLAENRLEQAACEGVVLFWQERRGVDAWFPVHMHPGWPHAKCVIHKDARTKQNIATVRISFAPETDGERGGIPIETLVFPVVMIQQNIISRAFQVFNKRDLKAERETLPAPTGRPDAKPEMVLRTRGSEVMAKAPQSVKKPADPKRVTADPNMQKPPIKPGAQNLNRTKAK